MIDDHQDCDQTPGQDTAPDVEVFDHCDCGGDLDFETGETGSLHQVADDPGCEAAAQLLADCESGEDQCMDTETGFPVAVFNDVCQHCEDAAVEGGFAETSHDRRDQQHGIACGSDQDQTHGSDAEDCTCKDHVSLAELLDEGSQDDDTDDPRNLLCSLQETHALGIAEHVLCIVSCAGAVDVLIQGYSDHREGQDDEVLVCEEGFQALAERKSLSLFCSCRMEALFAAKECPQKHCDRDDAVDRGDDDPCSSVAAHHADERKSQRGDDQVSDGRHGHAEQIQLGQILVVIGHGRCQ